MTARRVILEMGAGNDLLRSIPMGRAGTASEIAELAGFLASKEAAYLTGQWLAVDGGLDSLAEDCF